MVSEVRCLISMFVFQVVGSTMDILLEFGYTFQQRGLVKVKGKGDIMTYFLTGRDDGTNLPNQVSPF